ncbi:MAG: hypothetical protein JXM70_29495 [Pirellulales bacterium]|nr:hypothetical protein [Pirellulales bacterium]
MKLHVLSVPLTIVLAVALFLGAATSAMALETISMKDARPVWAAGRQKEMNVSVGFRAVFDKPTDGKPGDGPVILRVAASSIYRVWLNGKFLGYGPARAAHGCYRVDEWKLDGKLAPGKNLLAIEVAGYNCNSYYLLDQPSFLAAEVMAGYKTVAATVPSEDEAKSSGDKPIPFEARAMDYRLQKVRRFSFQRPFIESYRLAPESQKWLRDPSAEFPTVKTEDCGPKVFLKRRVLYPNFAIQRPVRRVAAGRMAKLAPPPKLFKGREMTKVGPKLKGFPIAKLEVTPTLDAQHYQSKDLKPFEGPQGKYDDNTVIKLGENGQEILEFKKNFSGFPGATITCTKPTRLWFIFDEVLTDGDVDAKRMGCANMIEYYLEPGTYHVESIEPYTFRYLKIACPRGDCSVSDFYLREYAHPPVAATFHSSDERLNRLFEAGVETFRQNALDIFMDCPSRERAGWLCDSFFTSRVEKDLTGTNRIERNFLQNFMLADKFAGLPEGVLPMCYPADHYDGVFIPNWAMFFVIELDEYARRTHDTVMVDSLRWRVMQLLEYLKKFENEDGLLEKLDGWVFVEWSAANKFVQDVNYPSNMLYAATLDAAGRLYKRPELVEKAKKILNVIRQQSFDGEFFVDNALRRDGKLKVTRNRSEVCQYFAFFFNVATPGTHPALWKKLCEDFGPQRQKTKKHAQVHKANSFIGNVLRIELLSRAGRSRQILDEQIEYLLYMVDRTGTLWEHDGAQASCNHGFASHACHTLLRDVLGIRRLDTVNKKITIRFADLDLQSCRGTMPTPDGPVELDWRKDGDRLLYRLVRPKEYSVKIENRSGKKLIADHRFSLE